LLTRNTFDQPCEQGTRKVKAAVSKADILNLISSDVTSLGSIGFTFSNLLSSQVEMLLGGIYVWFLLGKFTVSCWETDNAEVLRYFWFMGSHNSPHHLHPSIPDHPAAI
jgi:hypothetical protein